MLKKGVESTHLFSRLSFKNPLEQSTYFSAYIHNFSDYSRLKNLDVKRKLRLQRSVSKRETDTLGQTKPDKPSQITRCIPKTFKG